MQPNPSIFLFPVDCPLYWLSVTLDDRGEEELDDRDIWTLGFI